ncbi:conserved exported hypothetical protein [Verrucomicrobia bacterium]|nr:conserved exported hypothetical protein [Verrucomicrobiota bacterium]
MIKQVIVAVGCSLCILKNPGFSQGTAFTYQGQLAAAAAPANGSYDFTFALFAANAGGIATAGPVTNTAVAVTNGLFTTKIDFGPDVFTGSSNWLEIAVRANGGDSFTTLAPRQQLTPTPYALVANTAGNLSGPLSVSQLPPAVVTNNQPNVSFGNVTVSSISGNGAGLTNLPAAPKPANIIWVATSGRDFTSIQAAINSITNASASNPFLIKIAPGTFNEAISMQSWVSIEGSGQGTTTILANPTFEGATVSQPDSCELRNLTVAAVNSDYSVAYGIYAASGSPSIRNVTVSGSGTTIEAVYAQGASPVLNGVTITVAGTGSFSTGIHTFSSGTATLIGCTINVNGAITSLARGAFTYGGGGMVLKNCTVSCNGDSLSSENAGVMKAVACQLTGTIDVSSGGVLTKLQCYDANLNPL